MLKYIAKEVIFNELSAGSLFVFTLIIERKEIRNKQVCLPLLSTLRLRP